MPQYPDIGASEDFTVETLRQMIPYIIVKETAEIVNNSATYQDDDALSGIALGVGTWWVKFNLFMSAVSATPDLKTRWTFSGTVNTPVRMIKGPGPSNTGIRDALTPMHFGGVNMGTDVVYGLGASSGFVVVEEESFNVVVTVAGNLSLQWAQNTANASNTSMLAGSAVQYRQIA